MRASSTSFCPTWPHIGFQQKAWPRLKASSASKVRIRSDSSYSELSKTLSQVLPPFGGFSSICNQVDNQECHHIAQNTCDKNYNIFRVVLLPERYGSQMYVILITFLFHRHENLIDCYCSSNFTSANTSQVKECDSG